jgi:putative effector of murein hydrolase
MTSKRTIAASLLTGAIAVAIAFAIGESMGQRSMLAGINAQLDSVQASLIFNRLLDARKLKSLLAKGCIEQAAQAVDVAEDKDMELLAGFVNGKLDASTTKYISDRNPNLLDELKTFKSKYGRSWSETECKN